MIFKVLSIFKKLETLSELLHICELKVHGNFVFDATLCSNMKTLLV